MNGKLPVFNIERFAIHDGEGIRTAVFLRGCPLRCPWCANPESQFIETQPIKWEQPWMTCEEIFEVVQRDRDYYRATRGGLTLSGGEALLHAEALLPLMRMCREAGIGVDAETCGQVPAGNILTMLPYVDCFLFDLKTMDAEKLRAVARGDLPLILENFRRIAAVSPDQLAARVPVIPGFNHTEKDIRDIFRFVKVQGVAWVDLLPYHTLALPKYKALGREYPWPYPKGLPKEELFSYLEMGENMGLTVRIGG